MKISDVLRKKGSAVITVAPDETIASLLTLLAQHNIGAVVVSPDGAEVVGIVSERDIVRHLVRRGAALLSASVAEIMTSDVYTSAPDDDVVDIAATMTDHRIRHIPVIVEGKLASIVSIGDIVKARMDQLAEERDHFEAYITQ